MSLTLFIWASATWASATWASATQPGAVTPIALAFGAGALAVFNPCGFALLPAFVSYQLGGSASTSGDRNRREEPSLALRMLQGLALGVPLTAGFLVIFLVSGALLAAGGRALAQIFPWLGLLVGIALVALGARLLLPGTIVEAPFLSRLASRVSHAHGARAHGTPARRSLRAAWGFGLGYGLASLGCSLPVFLLVVGSAVAVGDVAQAAVVLAAYGAGMAVMLLGVALVATSLGDTLRRSVLPLMRWVQPLSALLILAAGVYIVVYQARSGLLIH